MTRAKNRPYPHLLPESVAIWERFLALYPDRYTHFDYDVRVGQGNPVPDDLPDNLKKMGRDLSQKRIDAIGYANDHVALIEIATRVNMRCLGQIFAYPVLYAHDYHPGRPIRTLVVCEELPPDAETVLTAHKVPYVQIYPDGTFIERL